MEFTKTKTKEKLNTFELLAPAGSPEILRAVIAAGADAVYVGGRSFGARAYADNFSEEALTESIDFAHLYGKKVYLTVNTLIKNQEMDKLYDYLLPYYERGLDAVLVQDLGAMRFIRENFPDLPVHTSTQMTVTGVEGARVLQQLGAERIVMAREVSLAEMKRIHDETGAELEAFVHGALCYCYSGQCLFSSMLGGRSGNRGRCAQPCRLPYSVDGKESYVLSLKDLCGIESLDKLREAGVYSLKIEGRMKQLSYAAGVVSVYRKAIDTGSVTKADLKKLSELGSRCGFTDAYYYRKNGADMVTFKKPNYEKKCEENYEYTVQKIKLCGRLTLQNKKPAFYEVSTEDKSFSFGVGGMEVMPAAKKPLDREDVKKRMEKTGDTCFEMQDIGIELDDNVFLPNGELNRLRREALEGLKQAMLSPYFRKNDGCKPKTKISLQSGEATKERPQTLVFSALIENRDQISPILAAERISRVYLDYLTYDMPNDFKVLKADADKCRAAGKEVYFALPRIFRAETSDFFINYIDDIKTVRFDGFLVRNYEEINFVKEYMEECELIADHSLYTYNDLATEAFAGLGFSKNTVPLELNRGEIKHRFNAKSEVVIYGRYPLMTSAGCVHANTAGCDKKPATTFLSDRYRTKFPVKNVCSACYNVVYNSLPVMLFSQLKELERAGISEFRLDFTVESSEEAEEVIALLDEFAAGNISKYPTKWQDRYTNGHYKRGVE
jgi:putative protease